jgi:hypothetical protein
MFHGTHTIALSLLLICWAAVPSVDRSMIDQKSSVVVQEVQVSWRRGNCFDFQTRGVGSLTNPCPVKNYLSNKKTMCSLDYASTLYIALNSKVTLELYCFLLGLATVFAPFYCF